MTAHADLPIPTAGDIVCLFEAADRYQRENSISDRIFLDQVSAHVGASDPLAGNIDIISESVLAKHKRRPPSRLKNVAHYYAIYNYLESLGYLASEGNIIPFARAACDFFGANFGSRSSRLLNDLIGHYEYFQRSSWYPGYVQVSKIEIKPGPNINQPVIEIFERQETGNSLPEEKGVPETVEKFDGLGIARQNCVYFMMRRSGLRTPKFCLIYSVYEDMNENPASTLFGFTLKGSNGPSAKVHLSKIILKKRNSADQINSRAISRKECDQLHGDISKRLFEMPIEEI